MIIYVVEVTEHIWFPGHTETCTFNVYVGTNKDTAYEKANAIEDDGNTDVLIEMWVDGTHNEDEDVWVLEAEE